MKDNMRMLLTAILASILFTACSSTAENKGNIYYFSEFSKGERMSIYEGSNTVLMVALEKTEPVKGKKTKMSGKTIFITFKKPHQLIKGAKIDFPNPDVEVIISEWSGKDSFNLNLNLKGSLKVKEHNPYVKTVLNLEVELRTGFDSFKKYSLNNQVFECIKNFKRYKGPEMLADSVDVMLNSNNITAISLNGIWKRVGEYFFDTQIGRWMEILHFKEELIWEISNGIMVKPANSEFRLDGGRIFINDGKSSSVQYLINSFKNDSLLVTNQESAVKTRYVFKRLQ